MLVENGQMLLPICCLKLFGVLNKFSTKQMLFIYLLIFSSENILRNNKQKINAVSFHRGLSQQAHHGQMTSKQRYINVDSF